MTSDWQMRMLEQEISALRRELRNALEERDRARETATRLEQEVHNLRPWTLTQDENSMVWTR